MQTGLETLKQRCPKYMNCCEREQLFTLLMVSMADVNCLLLLCQHFVSSSLLPHFVTDATPLISCIITCQYLCTYLADIWSSGLYLRSHYPTHYLIVLNVWTWLVVLIQFGHCKLCARMFEVCHFSSPCNSHSLFVRYLSQWLHALWVFQAAEVVTRVHHSMDALGVL